MFKSFSRRTYNQWRGSCANRTAPTVVVFSAAVLVAALMSSPALAEQKQQQYFLIQDAIDRDIEMKRKVEESYLRRLARDAAAAAALEPVKTQVVVPQLQKHRRGIVDVVLGAQWGDEGKGKLVDILSNKYSICARVAGGSNAGHTIVVDDKKYKFHLVPSGILNEGVHCVIGNGVVVHLRGLLAELKTLREAQIEYAGRIHISDRAHIVFDFHQAIDGYQEKQLAGKKIGTTLKGIGPSYSSKTQRSGLRVGDLQDMVYFESRLRSLVTQLVNAYPGLDIDVEAELAYYHSIRDELLPLVEDTVVYCSDALDQGKSILIEGANATMLDLDFGTYPYVTSSNPSVGSACTGLGVPPQDIRSVSGIVKAYCTRVGEGPFPTELLGETGETLRAAGGEYGTTTGRPRRCGWIDIPQLKYAVMLNGIEDINLTKLDVLSGFETVQIGVRYLHDGKEVRGMPASIGTYAQVQVEYETMPGWQEDISKCRTFEDLPANCQAYVLRLQELLDGPRIRWIGVGAGRADLIEVVCPVDNNA